MSDSPAAAAITLKSPRLLILLLSTLVVVYSVDSYLSGIVIALLAAVAIYRLGPTTD